MNGKLLLDTNAAIAFMAGDPLAVAQVTTASNAISVVALGELYYGAHNSDRVQQNVTAIENLMSGLSTAPW
jgi:predicted nucleic acid-binding protein